MWYFVAYPPCYRIVDSGTPYMENASDFNNLSYVFGIELEAYQIANNSTEHGGQ